jgi:exonuclease SbcC
MRIKEFSIRRYGPLPDTGRVALGNFCLLFGKNEHGKTLTIDALIKLLLHRGRKHRKPFEDANIDRVDEDPEGYLIIEHEGKETKFSGKEDLADIPDVNSRDYRNIFIIRNSDLSVAQESDFYRDVTGRLTGLRTEEIALIKEQLQELGNLTTPRSTASLREKLKAKATNARKLIEEIEALETEAKQEQLDKLEEGLFTTKEQTNEVNRQIGTLEDARKREDYEKGSEAYQILISDQQELNELEVYTTAEAELWSGYERDINNWERDVENLRKEADTTKRELQEGKRLLDEEELELKVVKEKKERIDKEIEPEVRNYQMQVGKARSGETQGKFFTTAATTSAVLLSISTLALLVSPSPLLYGLLALFLISTGIFAALRFSLTREKAHLAGVFERIKKAASRFGLAAEDVEQILSNIQKLDEAHSKKQSKVESMRTQVSILESQIKRWTETDIPNIERQSSGARETIEGLVQKSKVKTLEEYRQKLDLKSTYATSINTQKGILKSLFGSKGGELQENLPHWHEEIDALKEYENKAKDISYDEKAMSKLKEDQQKLQDKEQQLEEKLSHFQEQLREIEREANEILQPKDSHLCCTTSVDLNVIKNELLTFINRIETEQDNAVKAITIFEELQREEEEKISTLFGKDSPISQYFSEITGGIYQEVEFAQDETKKIEVTLEDGSALDAAQLSGATYDQLYLSIRLALGEKLLKGATGFFIMDDPFIKADKERLQRQIDILNKISQSGWQIIYFTAKDEVKEALKQDIENGNVSYMELPSIPIHQSLGLGSTSESTSPPKTEAQTNQGELPL